MMKLYNALLGEVAEASVGTMRLLFNPGRICGSERLSQASQMLAEVLLQRLHCIQRPANALCPLHEDPKPVRKDSMCSHV